jgi:hypothetical protein
VLKEHLAELEFKRIANAAEKKRGGRPHKDPRRDRKLDGLPAVNLIGPQIHSAVFKLLAVSVPVSEGGGGFSSLGAVVSITNCACCC